MFRNFKFLNYFIFFRGGQMKKFCTECGKGLEKEHKVCIHCGTPYGLGDSEKEVAQKPTEKTPEQAESLSESTTATAQETAPHIPKKPMSKKQKTLYSLIGAVVVILIGFYMWGNAYQSVESVEERYLKALDEKDAKKLTKLVVFEDGTKINENDAKAHLALADAYSKDELSDWYAIKEHGKFLLLFTANKVEIINQYLVDDNPMEGMTFTFNDKEAGEVKEDDGVVTYGPLVPGLYTVTAAYESESGAFSESQKMYFVSGHNELTMDLPISDVRVYVKNYHTIEGQKAYIAFNDSKINVDEYGDSEEFGPVILDGSQSATIVVEMPWGEVESEAFDLDATNIDASADLLTKEQFDQVMDLLGQYGEEYVKVNANKDKGLFTTVGDNYRDTFDDNYFGESYYAGKFNGVDALQEVALVQSDGPLRVRLTTQFQFEYDRFDKLNKPPTLEEDIQKRYVYLTYDASEKDWQIESVESLVYFGDFEDAVTVEGSGKLEKPDEKAIKKAKKEETSKLVDEDMETFMNDYYVASVDAINERDYSYMADYVTSDGPRKKEARDYIDYLDSKDIYEEIHEVELEKVEEIDEETWKVTTTELYTMIYPDRESEVTFRTINQVKVVNGRLQVDEFIDTKEID